MQSYVRTANILRTIAFITRIVALILLVLSFASVLLEFYVLMQELFPSGIGFSGRGTDTSVMLITAVAINFIPFLLLIILLIATYLLTALAELLRCQATKAT